MPFEKLERDAPPNQTTNQKAIMKKIKLILLAALICAPVISHAVTVINSLPYTINASGAYVLQSNLTANGTDGIDVKASNVSIDLAGFTLTQAQPGTGAAVNVFSGMSNVSVQNGTTTGFYSGVSFFSGSGDTIANVQVLKFRLFGVFVQANDCLIENCSVVGPGNGGYGIYLYTCSAVGIRNNQISECSYGIFEGGVTTPNALIGNYEATCTYGLNLSSGTKYQGNVTTNCTTPVTGGIAVGQENG
jgi:nitrous oxidase accessory protein NosD